jgi:phage-related protein
MKILSKISMASQLLKMNWIGYLTLLNPKKKRLALDKLFLLRNNTWVKKIIRFDKRAEKELNKFPSVARAKSKALIKILARDGSLVEPYGKKINADLFEIRVKYKGQWRLLYAYLVDDYIIILSAFHKKTQKTPLTQIQKTKARLKGYKL